MQIVQLRGLTPDASESIERCVLKLDTLSYTDFKTGSATKVLEFWSREDDGSFTFGVNQTALHEMEELESLRQMIALMPKQLRQ